MAKYKIIKRRLRCKILKRHWLTGRVTKNIVTFHPEELGIIKAKNKMSAMRKWNKENPKCQRIKAKDLELMERM